MAQLSSTQLAQPRRRTVGGSTEERVVEGRPLHHVRHRVRRLSPSLASAPPALVIPQ
jgi:hypothetical protein